MTPDRKEYYKKYYQLNRKRLLEQRKSTILKNPEQYKAYAKKYSSKRETKDKRNALKRLRKLTDPSFRACENMRKRVASILKSRPKFYDLLGCTKDQLKAHIEGQFQPGMTWENYGRWHIDHIFPLS